MNVYELRKEKRQLVFERKNFVKSLDELFITSKNLSKFWEQRGVKVEQLKFLALSWAQNKKTNYKLTFQTY